jgi:hypothetical protein
MLFYRAALPLSSRTLVVRAAKKAGWAFVVLDGTLIPVWTGSPRTGRSTPASTRSTG